MVLGLQVKEEQEGLMETKNETGYVDTPEAARVLGVSQRAVRNLVARGQLEPKKDADAMVTRLLISVSSLGRWRSEQ